MERSIELQITVLRIKDKYSKADKSKRMEVGRVMSTDRRGK